MWEVAELPESPTFWHSNAIDICYRQLMVLELLIGAQYSSQPCSSGQDTRILHPVNFRSTEGRCWGLFAAPASP